MSGIDPQKLAQKMSSQNQKATDKMYDRVAAISNIVGGRLTLNPNDEIVEAIEILLGAKPGTKEEALTKLGATTEPTGPAALPATTGTGSRRSQYATVVLSNPDGTVKVDGSGTPLIDHSIGAVLWDDTKAQADFGLIPVNLPDGTPALTKRPATATPASPAVTHKVKVVDKHGAVQRELDMADFTASAAKYQIVEADPVSGVPTRVREVRFVGR